MTDPFEAARGERNWLERLGEKIPGFRGFQNRELRREVDKTLREHIAAELTRIKGGLREVAGRFADAGLVGQLQPFERLEKRLEGLAQAIRFTDYGATGLFDAVKIGEEDLARLYELDLSVLDEVEGVAATLAAIPVPGHGDPGPALEAALARVGALQATWARRGAVIAEVARP